MSKLAIVTDSTACIPPELVAQYHLHIIPLKLQWEGQTYQDGIDISPSEFYTRLEHAKSLPTTSQPSPPEFRQLFEQLAPDHDGILVLLISSGISGTVGSAQSAAAELTTIPIEVIDTRLAAGSQAMVVLAAARAAEQGASLQAAADVARRAIENMHVFFIVDTLEYLYKGGRIGGASRYMGTLLDIKPVLFLNPDGKIDALERVRTHHKAISRLVELIVMNAADKPAHLSVFHAAAPQAARDVLERSSIQLHCLDSLLLDLSPVIGSHVGPGTIGVAVYTE
jgi:fatty acid kinase fatty acid binding subunit